ncbi:Ig-like domain-containing protein [Candidatus Kryptonium thompsonii]|jgi:methionine-rich copper-binding protein CopC|uniref:Ig-like domain-containing protein n=1 Tax=Candidatus Kryptonium thompsonii TaxID=1633631 RepID=A0A0P1MGB4_9BACT|nr:Ig-like domain-containing protein [Candidatus Kryptonium thompsoni]CUS76845.1 Ig-like domain-containing protein [Candidatus Kryptonium thompsoni]CUS79515.1 Ig-like domain-containing protein [Candidatus Kryptonium thompsoni]CUS80522.1 Ig-like domain-containing protein [Candidatus Kryptonium thompsoni]CUS93441.1 Ig-like domain-containing protein [Candidatus Kryptonium thompsoni]CUS93589.1 Ig-like domain-containing protein [Candidatus Kryptonium thompsoni]
MRTIPCLIFVLIIIGCATQVPPSGGPLDTTPPEIVKTYPENGTVNFKGNYVEVEFSEYVDKRSVQDAIYISPYIQGEIQYKWSGRKLKLVFPEKLKDSTTYVITFGTEIKDLNAGNKMKESFTLAFSTGSAIDSGSIEGKIFSNKGNFMVFAYLIDKLNPDTLSPLHTKPDYATQAGRDGAFKFQFIKLGKYRLFAINDKTKNLLYDPGEDEYGVFWEDIVINSKNPIATNVIFKTTIEDTSKPFVSSVNVLDNSHILIKFSEKINPENATIKIEKNETETLPLITQIYPDSSKIILILLEKLDTRNKYQLALSKTTDLAGNELGEHIYEPPGEFADDTTAPTLIFSIPAEGENDVNLKPEIKLFFDDVLLSEPKIQLFDSTGNEIKVKAKQNLNELIIEPETELKPDELYTLKISEARDLNNNIQKDTLKLSFKTINPLIFGAIEGSVTCEDTISSVIISAFETSTGKKFTTKTKCNSKFTIEQIPQGRYLIEAFIDSNGNGTYDYGKVFPFAPSEKFTVYPDTVKVRARWTTENINIKF